MRRCRKDVHDEVEDLDDPGVLHKGLDDHVEVLHQDVQHKDRHDEIENLDVLCVLHKNTHDHVEVLSMRPSTRRPCC